MIRPRARRAAPGSPERGFTLVEVAASLMVVALVVAGLATSTRAGLGLVGSSNLRQTATQLAAEWTEKARGTPYDGLALTGGALFEPDPAGSDRPLTSGTYDAGAGAEPLVLVTAPQGLANHDHDTGSVPNVDFALFRFVTWVADGADPQAFKRVTVVVRWPGEAPGGGPNEVVVSTLASATSIGWDGTTSTSSPSATTTTAAPATTSTTAAPVCGGDVSGPAGSLAILAGTASDAGYTSSSTVTMIVSASDPCSPLTMRFSNDGATWSAAEDLGTSKVWGLAPGDGDRTVQARLEDANGNASTYSATVRVDGTPPGTPGSYAVAVLNGPKRARLTWTVSTDNDNLIGYRVYRRNGNGAWQAAASGVSATSYTDNDVQNNQTYSYYVVSYDAAGNESTPTATNSVTI